MDERTIELSSETNGGFKTVEPNTNRIENSSFVQSIPFSDIRVSLVFDFE